MVIVAKYENGVFKPLREVTLAEGTVVEIDITAKPISKSQPSIGDLGFAGMWRDRTDIKDGVGYVDALRDSPRG